MLPVVKLFPLSPPCRSPPAPSPPSPFHPCQLLTSEVRPSQPSTKHVVRAQSHSLREHVHDGMQPCGGGWRSWVPPKASHTQGASPASVLLVECHVHSQPRTSACSGTRVAAVLHCWSPLPCLLPLQNLTCAPHQTWAMGLQSPKTALTPGTLATPASYPCFSQCHTLGTATPRHSGGAKVHSGGLPRSHSWI